jgi:hypothetical protein
VRRALTAAGCALALGGCGAGASMDRASTPAQRIPLATFNCGEWSVARADIRQTVLDELHGFYGGPVSGKRRTQAYGTVLSDAEATRLFDTYCSRSYAGHFTIYKIYARAAAFVGTAP